MPKIEKLNINNNDVKDDALVLTIINKINMLIDHLNLIESELIKNKQKIRKHKKSTLKTFNKLKST